MLSTVPCKIHRYPPSAWFHLCRKNIPRSSQSEKSLPFPGYIPPESFFHSNYNIISLPLSRFYPPCQITTHDNGMLCRFSIKILAKPTGLKSMFLSDLCGNKAAEEARWEKDTIPQKKIVTKYQPMEQLLHLMTFRRNYPDHLPMCRNLHSHRFPFGHPCLHKNSFFH